MDPDHVIMPPVIIVLREVENHLFLLSADGKLSKGFPITGDSPFSIVFLGNDGFFLFAGTGNNTILKYKVQR